MRRVFLCSPFAGDTRLNLSYLRQCIRDCISRDEAPFAAHAIYPGALDDSDEHERSLGLQAGLTWLEKSDYVAVYVDLGISPGMNGEITEAQRLGLQVEIRTIPGFKDWLGKEEKRQ